MENEPLITIVTVCYMAESNIESTIKSVLNQTYRCEYLIVDGGSTDGTIEVVKKYNIKYISEKDNGIYDAMNKGIDMAKGKYIYFLNSGDILSNADIIKEIVPCLDSQIVYGNVILNRFNLCKEEKAKDLSEFKTKMPFSHQGVFVEKKVLVEKGKLDTKYRICSDYKFFLDCYINDVEFKYVDIPIAIYGLDGISSNNEELLFREMSDIQKEFGLEYKQIKKSNIIKKILKRSFLKPIFYYLKKKSMLKNGWQNESKYIWV